MMGDLSEVISNTVQVMSKYGERSGGGCRVSKQDFRALEKLMDRPLEHDRDHPGRVSGRGWSIIHGQVGAL